MMEKINVIVSSKMCLKFVETRKLINNQINDVIFCEIVCFDSLTLMTHGRKVRTYDLKVGNDRSISS